MTFPCIDVKTPILTALKTFSYSPILKLVSDRELKKYYIFLKLIFLHQINCIITITRPQKRSLYVILYFNWHSINYSVNLLLYRRKRALLSAGHNEVILHVKVGSVIPNPNEEMDVRE